MIFVVVDWSTMNNAKYTSYQVEKKQINRNY